MGDNLGTLRETSGKEGARFPALPSQGISIGGKKRSVDLSNHVNRVSEDDGWRFGSAARESRSQLGLTCPLLAASGE